MPKVIIKLNTKNIVIHVVCYACSAHMDILDIVQNVIQKYHIYRMWNIPLEINVFHIIKYQMVS